MKAPPPDLKARRSAAQAWRSVLRGLRVLRGLFAELSDQNAYLRHLAAHGVRHSPAEWRRFSDAHHRAKYERPKCC